MGTSKNGTGHPLVMLSQVWWNKLEGPMPKVNYLGKIKKVDCSKCGQEQKGNI